MGGRGLALGEIYIKLVVGFPNDQKVRALARFGYPDAGLARDLYVQMCLYCKEHLTDGFVPAEQLGILAYPAPLDAVNQLAKQLASVGLTKEVSNPEASGWQVCAFLKRNRSKEQVEVLSEVRREAGRTGGKAGTGPRKGTGQRRSQATAKQVANQPASKMPPIVQSTENRDIDASDEASSVPPSAGAAAPNIGDVVAAYVEGATASGQPAPATSLRARVGKQARQLVADGYPVAVLIESARRMGTGEWNDLAVQVRKDAASANGKPPSAGKQTNYTDEEYQSGW